MEKTDPTDAYLIADFGRVGRTKNWSHGAAGSSYP